MKFLLPTGIGDATWALTKAAAISGRLGDGRVEIAIACNDEHDATQLRALEYVQRFPFVTSARMLRTGAILKPGPHTDARGRYRYIDDGDMSFAPGWYPLVPNAPLERGERLETWFPDDVTDWTLTRQWANTEKESAIAATLRKTVGEYAILYPGPSSGNGPEGHNRGGMWSPREWVELAQRIRGMSLTPVAIGAKYDWDYYRHHIAHAIKAVDPSMRLVVSLVGQTAIGATLAVIRGAKFGVYYQSGLGVWGAFESVPTAMFWRPDGNSIHPRQLLCFDERMASAWVPPRELMEGRYLPCIYGTATVEEIAQWGSKQCRSST